jgi:hypothetical protein
MGARATARSTRAVRLAAPCAVAFAVALLGPITAVRNGAVASESRPDPAAAPLGDLPARVVRAHAEFDVFAPTGHHRECSFKSFVPIALTPQVPLRFAIATDPPGEATSWRIDPDGLVFVKLKDQKGEKHLSLSIDVDVLLMESVGCDDVTTTGTLYRRNTAPALKPYLRPLVGTNPDDPEVAKVAATLKAKTQDLVALSLAIDAAVKARVKPGAPGHDAAGEVLLRGSGGRLARANVVVALFLSQSVPTRLLGVVPARGGGSFEYLVDVNAGDEGWLRFDLLGRAAKPFPWTELEDIVLVEINADTAIAGGSRPRLFFCGGELTAGPKGPNQWICRELQSGVCPRATAKEILPVLVDAFGDERGRERGPSEALDVAASARASRSKPLVEWLAKLKPAAPGGSR